MSNITTLRDALFSTLAGLQDKKDPLDIDRAQAVCSVAREITATAKIEIDFLRATGSSVGSGFIAPAGMLGVTPTATGRKQTEQLPGGTRTTHTLR